MAKFKRLNLGSVCLAQKDEAGKPKGPNYIKIGKFGNGHTLKEGDIIRVESKKFQQESLEGAHAAGKLTGDNYANAKKRVDSIPEWVLGELVVLQSEYRLALVTDCSSPGTPMWSVPHVGVFYRKDL